MEPGTLVQCIAPDWCLTEGNSTKTDPELGKIYTVKSFYPKSNNHIILEEIPLDDDGLPMGYSRSGFKEIEI